MQKPKSPAKPIIREDAAEARILARREMRLRLLLEDGRDLARIQESGHFKVHRCSSIREYGERVLSLSARETYETLAIVRTLSLFPEGEEALLTGRTTPEALAALVLLVEHPEVLKPEDTWLEWAERESAKSLRKRIARRLKEAGVKRPPRKITVELGEQGSQDLDDARVLAAQSEREPKTISETVEGALREYVKARSPLERTPGQRRLPLGHCETRTVPAEVERGVIRRADGKCRLPFCDNDIFVEKIHVFEDFVDQGPQEMWNLDLHCKPHHKMQGRGEIRNDGTTDVPKFVDDRGVPLDRRWLTLKNAHPDSPVPRARLNGHVAESPVRPATSTGPPT